MDKHKELFADKSLDFHPRFKSSFLNNEVLLNKPVYRTHDFSNSFVGLNNSDNCFKEDTIGSYVNSILTNGSRDGLSSIINRLQNLSLGHKQWSSAAHFKELKGVIGKANNAYVQCMISQWVLESYKLSDGRIPPKLARKLKEILASSAVQHISIGKSRTGEKLNIFGLTDDAIKVSTQITFSEGEELNRFAMEVLKTNLERLKTQRKTLKDTFSSHCLKIVAQNSLLPEEQLCLEQDCHYVESRLAEAHRVLANINYNMQQLAQVSRSSEQDARRTLHRLLVDKASCLHTTTSILNLKMENRLYNDEKYTKAMNTLGDRLRTNGSEKSEELKALKNILDKYERKRVHSRGYSEMVSEYTKLKRQLVHKYQTLSMLNDPDISF